MTNQEENTENNTVAIEYLKKLIAENEQLKYAFSLATESLQVTKEKLKKLEKEATSSPPVYHFNIN